MFKTICIFLATNIAFVVSISALIFVIETFTGYRITPSIAGGYTSLAIYSLVFGFASAFFSLAISRMVAKWSQGVRLVTGSMLMNESAKMQAVYVLVDRLAKQHGIVMPEVGITQDIEPNAFATGPTRNRALVVVTQGLLDTMTQEEVEGVVGHEMAHVLNGDMVTMTLLQGILNTLVIFVARILSNIIASAIARSDGQVQWIAMLVNIVLQIALGSLAMLVLMAFSRHREYRADEDSARMVGKSRMVNALKKLANVKDMFTDTQTAKSSVAALQISSYSPRVWFSSHPPLADRISALEARYDLG